MKKYPPINPKCPHMLHGGDYNPDQWLHMPEILQEDMRLATLAKCNAMSVGIFAWSALEPAEGVFTFDWLDRVMDTLAANGKYAVLATPTGARPAWMSQQYPEVLRVREDRRRILHGQRHNHCYTSPIYREKATIINTKLAERYTEHPALLAWHVSNEYSGECYCPLCEAAFRVWLRQRYQDDLHAVNIAWNTAFWSHAFTDWSQIEPPALHGELALHGLVLDWKRFVTDQTLDFMKHETAPLRAITPHIPLTTNFMGTYGGLNYWKFVDAVDVVSWDCYPQWHHGDDIELAASIAFLNNLNRSFKNGKPYMLMESTPSVVNWTNYAKLKRPGMHLLASMQAVAHGADTVQYFQWRKSRGAVEKFHGAVVDHAGHEHTRVFQDVAEVGRVLEQLDDVVGTTVQPEVAVIFDWENRWALDSADGPCNDGRTRYEHTCIAHMQPCWKLGIPYDVIDMDSDFTRYKLLIAPMLYMVRPGVAERIAAFVRDGGTFVATYLSGLVDETDLVFLGGFPGPLRPVLGLWAEEIDCIAPEERNGLALTENALGLTGVYEVQTFCDLIHPESATALATYTGDFYAGRAALTVNAFGQGEAYYLAARTEQRFLQDFYTALAGKLGLSRALEGQFPDGVVAHARTDGERTFIFVMNFTPQLQQVTLPAGAVYRDHLTGDAVTGTVDLGGYGVRILTGAAREGR